MGNWGFRISQIFNDVKTCNDEDTIVTSKYPLLKGTLSGTGSTTVTDGSTNTVTIAHGLDYIPFAKAYTDIALDGTEWSELPTYGRLAILQSYQCWSYCDDTNLYLKFNWVDDDGAASHTFNYNYFIYVDKGKV